MPAASIPADEPLRLAALRSYGVLDTEAEADFDGLVKLAAEFTGCPIAAISLLDADRLWFKARHGLDADEVPRELAFCAHALLRPGEHLSVPDAARDDRFLDNALVTGGGGLRSYLGVPLVNAEGHALGTLCVIDRVPRQHDARMVETVRHLARAATSNLELRRALTRVSAASLTDQLTGLPNRRAVMGTLEATMVRDQGAAVIAMDLDHFKEANDAHGHAAGDALLCAAAERIRAALRPGDVVGRIGGDEFIAVLPGVTSWEVASDIAARVAARICEPVSHDGRTLKLGTTLGIAVAPVDAQDPQVLARLADEALIQAKRTRRGSIGRAAAADAGRVAREAALVLAIQGAAAGDLPGLSAHLQPIVDLRTAEVVGVEALARWTHPQIGPVSPGEMFDAALRAGRADAVSCLVRGIALRIFAGLRRDGVAPPRPQREPLGRRDAARGRGGGAGGAGGGGRARHGLHRPRDHRGHGAGPRRACDARRPFGAARARARASRSTISDRDLGAGAAAPHPARHHQAGPVLRAQPRHRREGAEDRRRHHPAGAQHGAFRHRRRASRRRRRRACCSAWAATPARAGTSPPRCPMRSCGSGWPCGAASTRRSRRCGGGALSQAAFGRMRQLRSAQSK
jgi:diguanylate cyclase (GGDEF)-like protein